MLLVVLVVVLRFLNNSYCNNVSKELIHIVALTSKLVCYQLKRKEL